MIRKFLEGLVFGAGFAISFILIAYFVLAWTTPNPASPGFTLPGGEIVAGPNESLASIASRLAMRPDTGNPFRDLNIDDQIRESSVIALATFEPATDGMMRAVIREFLKKEPGAAIHYSIGDEYAPASYYPKEGVSYGDGTVIFFVGSPASVRMSMSYYGDRISALGNLPLRLLREKCAKAGDGAGVDQP